MLGRDSRTLSKIFEEVVFKSFELDQLLVRLREAVEAK